MSSGAGCPGVPECPALSLGTGARRPGRPHSNGSSSTASLMRSQDAGQPWEARADKDAHLPGGRPDLERASTRMCQEASARSRARTYTYVLDLVEQARVGDEMFVV